MYPKEDKFLDEEEDEHIHSRKAREKRIYEDAMTYEEDGFMEGYEEDVVDDGEGNYCKVDATTSANGKGKI